MTEETWLNVASARDMQQLRQLISELPHKPLLSIGERAFREVVGANFTGCSASSLLPSFLSHDVAVSELKLDFNEPNPRAKSLSLLLIAKIAVLEQNHFTAKCPPARLLAFRIALLWQKILNEPCATLKDLMNKYAEEIEVDQIIEEDRVQYWLERANSHLIYYDYDKCSECIQYALEVSGLNIKLAGKMGKRTRFQLTDIAQLVLTMESSISMQRDKDADVPADCALNDDTLLESVSFADDDVGTVPLSPIQLAVVLALFRFEKQTQHCDELYMEKAYAYLDAIIRQRRCWPVQAAALLGRCELEKREKRRIERACAQSELICKLMDGIDDETSDVVKIKRCELVLASGLEPFWKAHIIHAESLRSLGCAAEALLIYEKLEVWDCVIECFKELGQLEKGEALIRRLLLERPDDSMLYCYLGDITMETSYYETAIKMSNDQNARARKSFGFLMLLRNQYDSAYKHLRRSLELQPIQLGVWFNAGYCAWKLQLYADAVTCYHRCVSFEPEHFEAWNNLSAAYIKLKQKDRARRILQEALKFNYEHPKVWENYLLLCVDTGQFEQAIKAFHRLLDLSKQQKDDEVLDIIATKAADENSKADAAFLKAELVKLLGRVSAVQTLSSRVWKLYASLKKPKGDSMEEADKYIQLLERALLADSNKPNWVKDVDLCSSVLSSAVVLATERLRIASLKGDDAIKQAKSHVRISLKPLVTIAEREYNAADSEKSDLQIPRIVNSLNVARGLLLESSQ